MSGETSFNSMMNGLLRLTIGGPRGASSTSTVLGDDSLPTNIEIHPMPPATIQRFDSRTAKWNVYAEQLEIYFASIGCTDDKLKATMLLNCLSIDVYEVVRSMCDPDLPTTKSYEDLCKILHSYFVPHVVALERRRQFYALNRQDGDLAVIWLERIRRAAVDCKFGAKLNGIVMDKFITQLRGKAFDRLADEDIEKLTLERAVELAVKHEKSKETSDSVQFVAKKKNASDEKCKHCGRRNHTAENCKFRKSTCHKCGATGHISTVCKRANNNVNHVDTAPNVCSVSHDLWNQFDSLF